MRKHRRKSLQSGFTLLELLLALAIFTIIGIATVRQLTQIQNTKVAAFEDIDVFNDLRAAMNLMRQDLGQAFHIPLGDLGAGVKAAVARNESVPHTVFDGRGKELIFTSLSHRNFYADRRECEQTEISYFLFTHPGNRLPSLMKRESEIIDADVFTGGPVYRLVDNVEEFELGYWDDRQDKYVTDWNSDSGNYFDKFPLSVRVRMTIAPGGKIQPLKTEAIIKIAFPNNTEYLVQF